MRVTLPERPLLKPWYRIGREPDRIVFEYAGSVVAFEGEATRRLLPALLPLLNGERTLGEITAYLGEAIAPAAEKALATLARHGALTEGPPLSAELPRRQAETIELLVAASGGRLTLSEACGLVRDARVGIAGSGARAEEIARLLRLSGLEEVERLSWSESEERPPGLGLVVAAPDPDELGGLTELNRIALRAGFAWLQVLPFDGRLVALGPLFVPGETCCHECFGLRWAANVGYPDELRALARSAAPWPSAPALDAAVAGLAALVALRWLVLRDPELPGVLHALEWGPAPRLASHTVYRVPRCPACSGLASVASPLPWHEKGP